MEYSEKKLRGKIGAAHHYSEHNILSADEANDTAEFSFVVFSVQGMLTSIAGLFNRPYNNCLG